MRSWVGTYTLVEINYAKQLGYDFIFYECYAYQEMAPIFRDFMKVLFYLKISVSGFPHDCISQADKVEYCSQINDKMQFTIPLSPKDISKVPHKRLMYKNFMNEFVGKFSQKIDKPTTMFVSSQHQLDALASQSKKEIVDICAINDLVCQVKVQSKKQAPLINRRGNCIIGAYITAYNRISMHKAMESITAKGGCIYYTCTDSISYSLSKQEVTPLSYGVCPGEFKKEYGSSEIFSFFSLGPKETCVTYQQENGAVATCIKVRGLCLTNLANSGKITPSLLDEYIENVVKNEKSNIAIPQIRKKHSKNGTISKMCHVQFTNAVSSKRNVLVDQGKPYVAVPYGYNKCQVPFSRK
jgi:hypothetical protein